jgi:hypothetical protein
MKYYESHDYFKCVIKLLSCKVLKETKYFTINALFFVLIILLGVINYNVHYTSNKMFLYVCYTHIYKMIVNKESLLFLLFNMQK